MKKLILAFLLFILSASIAIFLVACRQQAERAGQGWTPPTKLAETEDSFGGAVFLYKWQNTVLAWQMRRGGEVRSFLMKRDDNSWSEGRLTDIPLNTWADPDIDQVSNRLILKRGFVENEQLFMSLFVVRLTESAELKIEDEKKWTTDKKALLGEIPPNVKLNEPGRRRGVGLGPGLVSGPEMYIPYSLHAKTYYGINNVSNGPFNNGIFHSADFGKTWRMEKISDWNAGAPALCKTAGSCYYFALEGDSASQLWFSRRVIGGDSWDAPQYITTTFARASGYYDALGDNDTVHLCWLDQRNEKIRINLDPYRQNYEVVYSRRRDSDTGWSKEVILSKGLLYSYRPSISVEGDKVVVAWAGAKRARDWHNEYSPNDIYYATSKDGGKTWTKPMKVTDDAKNGSSAGWPKVVLLNGVIHLTYVQGKMNSKQESPGLTRLGQSPWPIFYRQRPFPD